MKRNFLFAILLVAFFLQASAPVSVAEPVQGDVFSPDFTQSCQQCNDYYSQTGE